MLLSLKTCNGTANATRMVCLAPGFPEDIEERSDIGQIFIDMDGERDLWTGRFDYHPDAKVIPFENEDRVLALKPGDTEVSLHVC